MRLPTRLLNPVLLICVLLAGLSAAGCATTAKEATALDRAQYAWSAAIRWGDFEGARNLVDPVYREAHPLTPLERERYEQVQISAYRDLSSDRNLELGTAVRDIEIGVINRHTQTERTVRYREQWRWDEAAGTWWLQNGLPDLWDGE